MKYRINFTKRADNDINLILKSGNKTDIANFRTILEELQNHPKTGTGKPELLKHELSGYWSRRINKKDRLVYQILEDEVIVVVVSALGHY
ncbi:MAG TPA: Txe/YoeB family addiction module toxin [Saprospiraceae bacterium]|nr:Txe/YoeB family addiction module toxin [Saprospiraceae bacterium]